MAAIINELEKLCCRSETKPIFQKQPYGTQLPKADDHPATCSVAGRLIVSLFESIKSNCIQWVNLHIKDTLFDH